MESTLEYSQNSIYLDKIFAFFHVCNGHPSYYPPLHSTLHDILNYSLGNNVDVSSKTCIVLQKCISCKDQYRGTQNQNVAYDNVTGTMYATFCTSEGTHSLQPQNCDPEHFS